jgi:hypothetical protein
MIIENRVQVVADREAGVLEEVAGRHRDAVGQTGVLHVVEQRPLTVGVPRGGPIGPDGLGELVPACIQPPVEHGDEAADVVGLARHQVLVAEGAVEVAAVLLLQHPQRGTAGQQHLGRARCDPEAVGELAGGGAGRARQLLEQSQLVGRSGVLNDQKPVASSIRGSGESVLLGMRGTSCWAGGTSCQEPRCGSEPSGSERTSPETVCRSKRGSLGAMPVG